ncbi:hypothetical protein HPTD01_595 [Halomonas sp. TD01]|nr:hypothetical protein HPTD01_595 [Halomonas sp. TD01]
MIKAQLRGVKIYVLIAYLCAKKWLPSGEFADDNLGCDLYSLLAFIGRLLLLI